MVRPGSDKLSGQVEVDETYLGGLEEGVRGRKTEKKALIAVGAEENGKGIGRIRMCRIKDASATSLHPFVVNNIESGSVIHTDGWEGYSGLDKQDYSHKVTVLRGKKESASEILPRVHRVVSLLKRWLMGTHQGAVSHEQLD
jgi:transposase-like protein